MIDFDGEPHSYLPIGLRFHSPAEHRLNKVHYDLEVQLEMSKKNPKDGKPALYLSFMFDTEGTHKDGESLIKALDLSKLSSSVKSVEGKDFKLA